METAAILQIIAFATQYGIPAAQKIIELLQKKDATIDDVKAAFAAAHKSYEEYEALPVGSPIPKLPA